eukprot:1498868-Rhodomonas_salina.1
MSSLCPSMWKSACACWLFPGCGRGFPAACESSQKVTLWFHPGDSMSDVTARQRQAGAKQVRSGDCVGPEATKYSYGLMCMGAIDVTCSGTTAVGSGHRIANASDERRERE